MYGNVIAESEQCKKYRDFGTIVSGWSKWNGGVNLSIVFFTITGWLPGSPRTVYGTV